MTRPHAQHPKAEPVAERPSPESPAVGVRGPLEEELTALVREFVELAEEIRGHYGIEECAGPGQPATEWDDLQGTLQLVTIRARAALGSVRPGTDTETDAGAPPNISKGSPSLGDGDGAPPFQGSAHVGPAAQGPDVILARSSVSRALGLAEAIRDRKPAQEAGVTFVARDIAGALATALEALRPPRGSREPPARLSDDELKGLAAEVGRRTAPVFAASGWEWGNGQGMEVPDEHRIAETVLRLLRDAGEERVFDGGSMSSGRFVVIREVEEGENVEWCTVELRVGRRIAKAPEPEAAGPQTEGECPESIDQTPSPGKQGDG